MHEIQSEHWTQSGSFRRFGIPGLYIVEIGDLSAVVGSAAAAVSLALPESSWVARESVPLALLDPAGAESSSRGSIG
jgi:hypothetical protein